MLTAKSIQGRNQRGRIYWLCYCDCGNVSIVQSSNLVQGNTSSCGCLATKRRIESNTIHGCSNTTEFSIWEKMIDRCTREKSPAYKNYGARGIHVCSRWELFSNFLNDMGKRPTGTTLDRIDNNKGYAPENCRWASIKEQARNKRTNRLLTYHGQTKCMAEWCEILGLKTATVCQRLNRYGWSVEKALSTRPIMNSRWIS